MAMWVSLLRVSLFGVGSKCKPTGCYKTNYNSNGYDAGSVLDAGSLIESGNNLSNPIY